MKREELTSKQLVQRALQGRGIPHVPTGPLAVHFCAAHAGYTLRQYTTDPQTLADSVIRYHERFRPDAVWLSADTWVSAEAMGARVGTTGDDQPFGGIGEPLIRTTANIGRIPAPNTAAQGRYPLMLEALTRIRNALGEHVFIVACFDQYPFSLAGELMGLERIMLALHDDPALVEALMERCLEYGLAYGRALADAGADLLSGGDSPAGLLGPELYREFALPYEQRLIAGLKAATGKPVSLHICGDATPILAEMARSGADVLEIDHQVDLADACEIVGPDIGLWGNLDPVGLLLQGSEGHIREASRRAVETVRDRGHRRFVLSSGCTLAPTTPEKNLDAMLHAAVECRGQVTEPDHRRQQRPDRGHSRTGP